MATNEGTNESWRKLLVPGAASLVGAGVGLALTRTNKLRDSLPSLGDVGIGDLAEDLKKKLSSTGSASNAGGKSESNSSSRRTLDTGEFEEHRRRRADRRKQRAGR
jgi:hypothetical protein